MPREPIYVISLRAQHESLVGALLDRGVRHIATIGTTLSEGVQARIAALGGTTRQLESLLDDATKWQEQARAAERASQITAAVRRRAKPIALDGGQLAVSAEQCAATVSRYLPERLASTAIMLASLDALADAWDVRGVVFSEDYSRDARAVVEWARRAGVRSFHLVHGTNIGRAWGIDAQLSADYALLTGQRGKEIYLDGGVDPQRMIVVGSPAWDGYHALRHEREALRVAVREKLGLGRNATLVMFAVTTFDATSALCEIEVTQRTLRGFMAGVKAAYDAGCDRFAVMVKDRVFTGKTGGGLVAETAREFGVDAIYVEGRPEALVCASDVVVASESNISIEAVLCDVPTINLWARVGWINGPRFIASDGIGLVPYNRPEILGAELAALVNDPAHRAEAVARQRAVLEETVFMPDGKAAQRAASSIIELCEGR